MLYVDQWCHVKHKSNNLRTNWLDVDPRHDLVPSKNSISKYRTK